MRSIPPAIAAIAPDGQLTPAQRRRFMIDLAKMLGLASEDELVRVRAVAARYAPEDIEDLEALVYLGQVEMGKRAKEG